MKAKSKDNSLSEWVSENKEELRFVVEHGSTDTIQAQAEAMLKVAEIDPEKE